MLDKTAQAQVMLAYATSAKFRSPLYLRCLQRFCSHVGATQHLQNDLFKAIEAMTLPSQLPCSRLFLRRRLWASSVLTWCTGRSRDPATTMMSSAACSTTCRVTASRHGPSIQPCHELQRSILIPLKSHCALARARRLMLQISRGQTSSMSTTAMQL